MNESADIVLPDWIVLPAVLVWVTATSRTFYWYQVCCAKSSDNHCTVLTCVRGRARAERIRDEIITRMRVQRALTR